MRRTQSLPGMPGTPHASRAPLCPPGRPSGVSMNQGFESSVHVPGRTRWQLSLDEQGMFSKKFTDQRSVWAADSFDIHRALNQKLPRPKHTPQWRINMTGDKLSKATEESCRLQGATDAWDLHRPANVCPPPWAHNMYPRAKSVTCSTMSSTSLVQ
eukprot:gnl/TRDRNA2_/TRDRNA2_186802_c0_seq1.p1 gnl/TRDRNA2_/TRDRNA2_186802_c0~~gnl/TRDRNA2_/TRDRNA2_186802_c0_seq1.p1  ORF type:complete len:172 (-),score=16.81 gnl/TRDRNA2_/TRDRNA2_186802_c0_seq1:107-574(-)